MAECILTCPAGLVVPYFSLKSKLLLLMIPRSHFAWRLKTSDTVTPSLNLSGMQVSTWRHLEVEWNLLASLNDVKDDSSYLTCYQPDDVIEEEFHSLEIRHRLLDSQETFQDASCGSMALKTLIPRIFPRNSRLQMLQ